MDNQLPFPEAPAHELDRMISIASREVALRAKVYPRWIEAGRVSQHKADYELSGMRDILAYLQRARALV